MRARGKVRWLALVVIMAALTVSAQTGPARSGVNFGPRAASPRADEERVASQNLAQTVTLRLAQLEEDLQLTSPQMPAWQRYRERVQTLLEDVRRQLRGAAAETTAPKRLDALADGARNRLTAIEDVVDAGKALYAQLTPEQRVVADRRLALPLAALAGTEARAGERGATGGPGAAPTTGGGPTTARP